MLKKNIKTLIGWLLFYSRLHRFFLRGRAIIVAFHSVNDEATDSDINCTPDLFREYCEFFDRFFDVVTLAELLNKIRNGKPVSRCLVITFDDGYEANFSIAAPILDTMNLPATFFITTGFIDSDVVAPWDEKLSIKSQWMTWNDVAKLSRQGFDIGGHTVSHVSLADVSEDVAIREIHDCKSVLESKLEKKIVHFAYPFGGRDNISEGGKALVKDAEFECCVSCYGGTVMTGENPYALQRAPITSRHISPYDFGFDCIRESGRLTSYTEYSQQVG